MRVLTINPTTVRRNQRQGQSTQTRQQTPNSFEGVGHILGGAPTTEVNDETDQTIFDNPANDNEIGLDEAEPVTNIHFRLADGTRLVGRFNHSHTVNDLHAFINSARPRFSTINYVLVLFPNIELTRKNVSVKEANLLNAVLT